MAVSRRAQSDSSVVPMRKALSRFSPSGTSKKEAVAAAELEAKKRTKQLKEKDEETAIMQEVCQDIEGKLAVTVNIMEAMQDEIEMRAAQSERDKSRIRTLEGALAQTGKATLMREKDDLVKQIQALEQGMDSSSRQSSSDLEAELRTVAAERDALTYRLNEVEKRLEETNAKCRDLAADLTTQCEACKTYEAETKSLREELLSVQTELSLASLGVSPAEAGPKDKIEDELEHKYRAMSKAVEAQVKSAEQRALESERKVETMETLSSKQRTKIDQLTARIEEKEASISHLKDSIGSLEASLEGMSKTSTSLADELESKDTQIDELKKQIATLSEDLVKERTTSSLPSTQVSPPAATHPILIELSFWLKPKTKSVLADQGYLDNIVEIERLAFEREDQLENYAATLHSHQMRETTMRACLKEVKMDRDNLQMRLGEANSLLQETRVQLRTLDVEADKLRQSLASSKQLQTEQTELIRNLKETVDTYAKKMHASDTRLELMRVEMEGLTDLAQALNTDVAEKAVSLERAKAQVQRMREEAEGGDGERRDLRETIASLEQHVRTQKETLEYKTAELMSAEQMISFLELETDNLREQLMISEGNTSDSDSAAKDLKAKISALEEERDSLYAELDEAEQMATEEAKFTKENIQRVQLYSETLAGMQSQVNRLQTEADALRGQVSSYKEALEERLSPVKAQAPPNKDAINAQAFAEVSEAIKDMLESKIEALQSEIESLQDSKDAILRDKSDFLLKIDTIVDDGEICVKDGHASLESKVHDKITRLMSDYTQLKATFNQVKTENTEKALSSPSLSDLRNINRDIDNLSSENDHLREELYRKELYRKEKRYSEAAEKNLELLTKLSALESEESRMKEKVDELRSKRTKDQEHNESIIAMLKTTNAEMQDKLHAEVESKSTLVERNAKLETEVSEQQSRMSSLEEEKARLLDKVADLEEEFTKRLGADKTEEYERALQESQAALAQVKSQLKRSCEAHADFVATVRGEYRDVEEGLVEARAQTYQVMGEMMMNFETVLHQAKQDCLSLSNELVETTSEAKSLRVLSAFSAAGISKKNRHSDTIDGKGGVDYYPKGGDSRPGEGRGTHGPSEPEVYPLYDENTPLRTPEALVRNPETPYTRIENILMNRPRGGHNSHSAHARTALGELSTNLDRPDAAADLMEKIEKVVSKQISELGLNAVASQFEKAVNTLEMVHSQTARDRSPVPAQEKPKKRSKRKPRDTSHRHAPTRDYYGHSESTGRYMSAPPATKVKAKAVFSSDMEKLAALEDRLGRVETKYRVYMQSGQVRNAARTKAVAARLSHQTRSIRALEERLRTKTKERRAPTLSPPEREILHKFASSSELEEEVHRRCDTAPLPPNFLGKRIFAVEERSGFRNRERMERLRSEMTTFQVELCTGESKLDELEAHAYRARQILAETQKMPSAAFVL